jgi:GTP-binding protein
MEITSADFLCSNTDIKKLPADNLPEVAFIGRSNVGKSSLINMLVKRKGLAKTSSTPGKTQTINHFLINKQWYLVDLPGYGYAKVSREQRNKWQKMIMDYLIKRKNLRIVYVLVDIRIPPQKSDVEMINMLGENNLAIAIIYTKTDKLSKVKSKKNAKEIEDEILQYWESLPPVIHTSSETGEGREALLKSIGQAISI